MGRYYSDDLLSEVVHASEWDRHPQRIKFTSLVVDLRKVDALRDQWFKGNVDEAEVERAEGNLRKEAAQIIELLRR